MLKARLLTIGTEITAGEVVNSNAAWISQRLEERGARVMAHLTVRDQREEILAGLRDSREGGLLVVTGGLGPTSDDVTRAVVAEFCDRPLEFDEAVWAELVRLHESRNLPVREAHRHQCWFPRGSARLSNPVGTALGFTIERDKQTIHVLPGPPRELAAMWTAEVEPRLGALVGESPHRWVRWNTLGAPESEVAEVAEPILAGRDVEVGYRAQVPYVKVKVFVDPVADADLVGRLDRALSPWIVGRGAHDLADELLERWPEPALVVIDRVTRLNLINRLFEAQRQRLEASVATPDVQFFSTHEPNAVPSGLVLNFSGEELHTELHVGGRVEVDTRRLPFKLKLDSERGRRAAAEWALWHAVKVLRKPRE